MGKCDYVNTDSVFKTILIVYLGHPVVVGSEHASSEFELFLLGNPRLTPSPAWAGVGPRRLARCSSSRVFEVGRSASILPS